MQGTYGSELPRFGHHAVESQRDGRGKQPSHDRSLPTYADKNKPSCKVPDKICHVIGGNSYRSYQGIRTKLARERGNNRELAEKVEKRDKDY
jgi:hypothetical protein